MDIPEIEVRMAALSLTRPWDVPPGVATVRLVESSSGATGRVRSDVAIFHDGKNLHLLFSMEDDELNASIYGRDGELWREDVVEAFLQPGEPGLYYEFEASPNGALFDARVSFPGPTRETMSVDVGWDCSGYRAWVRRLADHAGDGSLEILLTIPFACLGTRTPRRGETWRANFYRIDRSRHGDMFAAWSPTLTPRPDFHVPERFGTLVFA